MVAVERMIAQSKRRRKESSPKAVTVEGGEGWLAKVVNVIGVIVQSIDRWVVDYPKQGP